MEPHELPHDHPAGPHDATGHDPTGVDAPTVSLVLPWIGGAHAVTATIDSDADGTADTAVIPPPRGGPDGDPAIALVTDTDRDRVADVLTSVAADGSAHTTTLGDPGWDAGWDRAAPPAPVVDPSTGSWTRSL